MLYWVCKGAVIVGTMFECVFALFKRKYSIEWNSKTLCVSLILREKTFI